jgi:hypothetical protein
VKSRLLSEKFRYYSSARLFSLRHSLLLELSLRSTILVYLFLRSVTASPLISLLCSGPIFGEPQVERAKKRRKKKKK